MADNATDVNAAPVLDDAAKSRLGRIMGAMFRKSIAEPNQYVSKMVMDEQENTTWYAIMTGMEGENGEYLGGEYLIKVMATKEFPQKPPTFYVLTPNGLYDHGKKVCVSIGEYHADQWRPALGMVGLVTQLVSGMIGWKTFGGGINIVSTTADEKLKMAKNSSTWNAINYPEIIKSLNDSHAGYSALWKK